MSDEDTEDECGLQALKNNLDDDWDLQLPNQWTYTPPPPLEDQLKCRLVSNTLPNFSSTDFLVNSSVATNCTETDIFQEFQVTQEEQAPTIKNCYPGRETFNHSISGLLFTEETTLQNEKLFMLSRPSRLFGKYIDLTTKELKKRQTFCLETLLMGYCKLLPEERHAIGKYVLFTMSIHQEQATINLCFELLSYFEASWAPSLEVFLQVFNNWGIHEEFLHPPFKSDDSVNVDKVKDSCITIQDSNIFKVLDYLVNIYRKKPLEGWERSTVILRGVLLIWLDRRFISSWERAKFSTYVSCIVDTISQDEWIEENLNAMGAIIDLPDEHTHNQSWIIENFLSHRSVRMQQFGRYLATTFFQRVLKLSMITQGELDMNGLQNILINGEENLKQVDLYTIYIFFSVLEHFIMTFMKKDMSESTKASGCTLRDWLTNHALVSHDGTFQCVDLQLIKGQLCGIKLKLNIFLEGNNFIVSDETDLKRLENLIAKK